MIIHTDGACRGNPGPSAFAFVIARDGHPPIEEAGRIPDTTNNQAEYTALVRALERAVSLASPQPIVIHSDSELMVKQMNGQYRVKDAGLKPLYERAVLLKSQLGQPVKFVHVRREYNKRADELCNEVLDGRRISTPPVVPRVGPSLQQKAIAQLTMAAVQWARGSATQPRPEAVWQQLWELLRSEGALAHRFNDDSEE
jgi:ribonuclease HI